jgi:Reverse transcriptase (RNA-dependent DNA polymerase)
MYKGVRQGDPLSSVLFILSAEGLSKILHKEVCTGIFKGLGPLLSDGTQLTHLQFADDTLIMLQTDPDMMQALKWTLQGFEQVSGLKVNYAKSDLIPLNIFPSEGVLLADRLGYKTNSLPLT